MPQPDFTSLAEKRAAGTFGSHTTPYAPVRTTPRQESPMLPALPMIAPPPPVFVDPQERRDAAAVLGVDPTEIRDITEHADGIVIRTADNASYIILNPGHEQLTGPDDDRIRVYQRPDWSPVTAGGFTMARAIYVDPNAANFGAANSGTWSMAQLVAEGERRAGVSHQLYESVLAERDPRSAMGLVVTIARRIGMPRKLSISQNATAKAAWRVIVESGWLAPEELAAL